MQCKRSFNTFLKQKIFIKIFFLSRNFTEWYNFTNPYDLVKWKPAIVTIHIWNLCPFWTAKTLFGDQNGKMANAFFREWTLKLIYEQNMHIHYHREYIARISYVESYFSELHVKNIYFSDFLKYCNSKIYLISWFPFILSDILIKVFMRVVCFKGKSSFVNGYDFYSYKEKIKENFRCCVP